MTRIAAIAVGLAAVLSGVFLSVGAAPADAKKPCWRELINDWYDGRIDGVYPARCYREAIKKAPEDLRGYSDLPSALRRVLQTARKYQAGGVTYVDAQRAEGRNPAQGEGEGEGEGDRTSQGPAGTSGPQAPSGRDGPEGPVQEALTETGRRDADSIPLPLIALGALALLLIASGAAGLVARWTHARRVARASDA